MKARNTYLAIFVLLSGIPAAAQSLSAASGDDVRRNVSSQHHYALQNNVWRFTNNPLSLSFYDLDKTSGSAELSFDFLSGAYRRAMDPMRDYSMNFSAESYNYLDKINLYGSFAFRQETLEGKTYSENYDPYNGNPYIAGSTLAGDYTKQLFAFKVVSTSKLLWNRMRFGVACDYNVGDMSRYNDPRSRVQLADYSITPGLTIELTSNDRLGLSGTYRYRKEKMLKPVAKSDNIDRYIYCTQKGVVEYSETGLLFFSRRYVGDYGGGELQYSHITPKNSLMLHCGATFRHDDVIGDRKENPGNFSSIDYYAGVASSHNSHVGLRHKANVTVSHSSGWAQECLQELTTEMNDQGMPDSYWKTVMKNIRYRNSLTDISAGWHTFRLREGKYLWDFGVTFDAEIYSSHYILPESHFKTAYIEPALAGGGVLYQKGSSEINISGRLGWHQNIENKLFVNPELDKEKLTVIRDHVTAPDYQRLGHGSLAVGLNLNYIFMTLKTARLYCSVSTNQYYALTKPSSLSLVQGLPEDSSSTISSYVSARVWSSLSIGILY